jgi:chemotaxis protein MotB
MNRPRQRLLVIAAPALFALSALTQAGDALSERIYFVQPDGLHALVYTTSRTESDSYSLWFREEAGYRQEDYLRDFLYLFPKSGEWSESGKAGHKVLKLPSGSFASLEWTELAENNRLMVDENGVYRFRNWDGKATTPDGYFGLWNSPGNFEKIAYSWVFPDNLEPVSYDSNRDGEWIQRHNTVTYYGEDVNKLSFDIRYRPASGDTYDDMKGLEGDGVGVEQQAGGVKVTLEETLLFPTGVAEISDNGKSALSGLAEKLKARPSLHVVVAGHTDNVPISGGLSARYPTNWELASARSINIIHYLVDQGVAENRMESQSFSYMKPKRSNDTAEGRAANRRIEVFLSEIDEATAAAGLLDSNAGTDTVAAAIAGADATTH